MNTQQFYLSRRTAPLSKTYHLGLVSLVALGLASHPAQAQISLVDQSQTDTSAYIAQFGQGGLAQSFQPAHDNITGATIFLQSGAGSGSGNVTITLYDALPSAGGHVLASGTSDSVVSGQAASVEFTKTSLTPNQTYYLGFTDTNSAQGIAGSVENPYGHGETFANSGYQGFSSFDYAFQTRYSPDDATAAPEPSSVAAFAFTTLGAAGLILKARRRKAVS